LFAAPDTWLSAVPDDYYGIPPTSAVKALSADPRPFLIDVGTPQEIADAGCIEGSVNIPIRDLAKNLDKLPVDKTAPTLTYCAVGQRWQRHDGSAFAGALVFCDHMCASSLP
jgi:rhodanese-related sulfurtransferase